MFDTWQLNLILFYLSVVIFIQCYKVAIKNVTNDGAATMLIQSIAGISVLALVPFLPLQKPEKLGTFFLLGAACIFYAINDRLQMTARKNLDVSTFSVIGQLTTVFVIIYGLTIFREPTSLMKLAGATLIIVANALIFYRPGKHKIEINKYSILAMCAALAFATALSIDINISKDFNLPLYISLTMLIPAVIIGMSGRISPLASVSELKKGNPALFVITGVAWSLSIFFSLRAFRFGHVNSIITLEAVAVILNVLAAYIFLKERDKPFRKISAAILIIIGVLLTTL